MRQRRATLILWNQKILFYTKIALFHGELSHTPKFSKIALLTRSISNANSMLLNWKWNCDACQTHTPTFQKYLTEKSLEIQKCLKSANGIEKRLTLEFLLDYRLTPYPPSKSSENTAIQQGLMCHKTQDPCQRYRCQYFITT